MNHQTQSMPASRDVPVTGNDLALFSAQLENQPAEEILRWAAERYAPRLTSRGTTQHSTAAVSHRR